MEVLAVLEAVASSAKTATTQQVVQEPQHQGNSDGMKGFGFAGGDSVSTDSGWRWWRRSSAGRMLLLRATEEMVETA
jgi:hypothetical protein